MFDCSGELSITREEFTARVIFAGYLQEQYAYNGL